MKKNELTVKGTQNFMGIEIPVVYGGFGEGQKCMADKTIAEIHTMREPDIRRRITDNLKRFKKNVDLIDLKSCASGAQQLLTNLGYTQMQISKAEHIYILSERGYAKLIKIMDSDLAWDIHDKLIDEYFKMKEQKQLGQLEQMDIEARKLRAEAMRLNAKTKIARTILDTYKEAGVDANYKVLALNEIYSEVGIHLPLAGLKVEKPSFDKETIAKQLGILSKNGNPHSQAVGAIIEKVGASESEIVRVPFMKNGHSGSCNQYTGTVVERIEGWLIENGYPAMISRKDGSKVNVRYEM